MALNSYHLAGGGGRFPEMTRLINQANARLQYGDVSTRQMVMDYIQAHPQLVMPAGTNAVVVRDRSSR